ncbi:HK97 family phage major capsid protein [Sphingobium wenxiniae]|uniref:HK97 family phage major capsid protein n=1 Tax=Sphingobium wenxiniae (strain DSM 21828 / CGMCC 1.7748 / JZ-1) TaxID=595605 RepID=A0A562KIS5_SPHWJ|nr:phage major capsid protein [Sphingobium wenxiniae]MBB6192904.1 HK97 family phage major capsid protein [Sphingobium wenxiniae]TWH95287.1 HK97 family phage major capsid protein [Sphingobium wenxiniae]
MKTSDLIEQSAAIESRMKAAHEADDQPAFEAAEAEFNAIKPKLERQRKIDAMERREAGTPLNGDNKLTSEIRSRFNIGRAIAGAAGLAVDWGFESEMQGELAKRAGRNAEGVFIPTECFETRVLTTTTGAELVPTDHRPDQYVNALVASAKVRALGSTILSGLTGNLSIPRETASPAIGWVAENTALTAGDADFDSITLSPKHAGALSEWSRNMLMQASPDVEALLRQMLARNLALAIDKAAILGGGANEPKGVLATTGIQKLTAPASLFDAVADAVALADVENVGASRGLLTTPEIRKIAAKALDANGLPIGLDKVFGGVSSTFSNQVPKTLGGSPGTEHGMIYGDWSELLIGIWSEIDILVNPFESTAYSKGNVMIRAMATVDCAVRHPKAFVSIEDVTTATPAMPEVVTP